MSAILKMLLFIVSSLLVVASAAPPQTPKLKLLGYSNLVPNTVEIRKISIPEGTRVNVNFVGGNWTDPKGKLIAHVIGGIGAEQGYVDVNGLFNLDFRYTVQFVSDQKFGYIQFKGFGRLGGPSKTTGTIETDSSANQEFTGRLIYAPNKFVGTPPVLTSSFWMFV